MRRLLAISLTLLLIALLIANSADFFFRQPYYEMWDFAVNSLAIGRARHFAEWYGPYSRWGFHHPGPAAFYELALGEWLFHDKFHLTPALYNAQVLAQTSISTAFFGAGLAVFARRLPLRACVVWFWPLAVALGALHFGFASRLPSYDFLCGPSAFASTWSAHEIVMPFLCLLTAAASVAAGDGQDLPLLALAAGTLLHLHVAQPLFVGPLMLLGYAGLAVACARRERGATAAVASPSPSPSLEKKRRPRWPGAAWRAYPWRHAVAGLVLAVFALPLVPDLFRGADSNLAAILHHLRTHHGEHKTLVRSLLYFLQFGAYTPYAPGRIDFGRYDRAGAWAYVRWHAPLYGFWLLGLLTVAAIILRPILAAATGRPRAVADEIPAGRARFLAWGGWFLLAGIGLTLYWGTIQDGAMFYYNSWLNFALYYFGLLLVITELSARLDARPQPVGRRWWLERVGPLAAAMIVCGLLAGRWRVRDAVPETTALMHESVRRVLDAAPGGRDGKPAMFEFPSGEWPVAAAVGLEMARAGRSFLVADRWVNEFGREHAERPGSGQPVAAMPWRFKMGADAVPWRGDAPESLAPATRRLRAELAEADSAKGPEFLLLDDTHLATNLPVLDVRDGQEREIDFRRGGNAPDFQLSGWSDPETWGTWSDGRRGILRFATGGQVEGSDVEMTVELHPFVMPSAGLTSQLVSVRFNGNPLGPAQRVTEGGPPLAWTIPAAQWSATVGNPDGAVLEFEFPAAASPAALDRTGHADDTRLLGVGISRIGFRAAPATSSAR